MKKNISKMWLILLLGLGVGFLNGFFGGGGGMIVVPVLIFICCLQEKIAHATALTIILPLSIVSAIIYLYNSSTDWISVLYVGIGFFAGGIVGSFLLKKINNKVLRIVFSGIMIVAGIKLIL